MKDTSVLALACLAHHVFSYYGSDTFVRTTITQINFTALINVIVYFMFHFC